MLEARLDSTRVRLSFQMDTQTCLKIKLYYLNSTLTLILLVKHAPKGPKRIHAKVKHEKKLLFKKKKGIVLEKKNENKFFFRAT